MSVHLARRSWPPGAGWDRKSSRKLAAPPNPDHELTMDYARSAIRSSPRPLAGAKPQPRKIRTGPLPTVPWRDLDRKTSIEHHLPALILFSFGLLAAIQLLLSV
jgi:hypothetical protein